MSDEFIISEHYVILSLLGYSLNKVYADLLQFNFTTSLWSEVYPESPKPVSPKLILRTFKKWICFLSIIINKASYWLCRWNQRITSSVYITIIYSYSNIYIDILTLELKLVKKHFKISKQKNATFVTVRGFINFQISSWTKVLKGA